MIGYILVFVAAASIAWFGIEIKKREDEIIRKDMEQRITISPLGLSVERNEVYENAHIEMIRSTSLSSCSWSGFLKVVPKHEVAITDNTAAYRAKRDKFDGIA